VKYREGIVWVNQVRDKGTAIYRYQDDRGWFCLIAIIKAWGLFDIHPRGPRVTYKGRGRGQTESRLGPGECSTSCMPGADTGGSGGVHPPGTILLPSHSLIEYIHIYVRCPIDPYTLLRMKKCPSTYRFRTEKNRNCFQIKCPMSFYTSLLNKSCIRPCLLYPQCQSTYINMDISLDIL
jgi:hypothetical protein